MFLIANNSMNHAHLQVIETNTLDSYVHKGKTAQFVFTPFRTPNCRVISTPKMIVRWKTCFSLLLLSVVLATEQKGGDEPKKDEKTKSPQSVKRSSAGTDKRKSGDRPKRGNSAEGTSAKADDTKRTITRKYNRTAEGEIAKSLPSSDDLDLSLKQTRLKDEDSPPLPARHQLISRRKQKGMSTPARPRLVTPKNTKPLTKLDLSLLPPKPTVNYTVAGQKSDESEGKMVASRKGSPSVKPLGSSTKGETAKSDSGEQLSHSGKKNDTYKKTDGGANKKRAEDKRPVLASNPSKVTNSKSFSGDSDTDASAKKPLKSPSDPVKKPKTEKEELESMSITLNFRKKTDEECEEIEEDSASADEKDKLLKKKDVHMRYNDLTSADGLRVRRQFEVIGLSGQGKPEDGLRQAYDNDPRLGATPSAIFIPPQGARQRNPGRKRGGMGVRDQLMQAANTYATVNGGGQNGPSMPGGFGGVGGANTQSPPNPFARQANQGDGAGHQAAGLPDGSVMYVPVGGQILAIPINHPEEDNDVNPLEGEDELEKHFLVQAFTRTGKQRVVAINLLRLWRILACLVINVILFMGLNFGAIRNINYNGTNTP